MVYLRIANQQGQVVKSIKLGDELYEVYRHKGSVASTELIRLAKTFVPYYVDFHGGNLEVWLGNFSRFGAGPDPAPHGDLFHPNYYGIIVHDGIHRIGYCYFQG